MKNDQLARTDRSNRASPATRRPVPGEAVQEAATNQHAKRRRRLLPAHHQRGAPRNRLRDPVGRRRARRRRRLPRFVPRRQPSPTQADRTVPRRERHEHDGSNANQGPLPPLRRGLPPLRNPRPSQRHVPPVRVDPHPRLDRQTARGRRRRRHRATSPRRLTAQPAQPSRQRATAPTHRAAKPVRGGRLAQRPRRRPRNVAPRAPTIATDARRLGAARPARRRGTTPPNLVPAGRRLAGGSTSAHHRGKHATRLDVRTTTSSTADEPGRS